MDIPSRIYLTGFMGAGKTSLGSALAEKLEFGFVDLDERVEEISGRSIPEIFVDGGESAFRRLERAVLDESFDLERVVIASGGGTLADSENMERALQNGLVVYLSAAVTTLRDRVLSAGIERPLAGNEEAFEALFKRRESVYRRADITFSVDNNGVADAADRLAECIRLRSHGT